MAIDWNNLGPAEVKGWLANVVVDRTLADYGRDHSRYEYAVLCQLAKRIAMRTWLEIDELTMSRLMAEETRRRVPDNPKWATWHRSRLVRGEWVDRLTSDAEKVALTVGREQYHKAVEKLFNEVEEMERLWEASATAMTMGAL
jgi:hypothetical protein